MFPGRAVDAAGAVGGGAAPDALVAAGAVAVLARGRVDAARAIARRAAPLAVLLVVAVLMLPRGRMDAARAVARTSAISAFRTHDACLSTALVYHNLGGRGSGNVTARGAENPVRTTRS